MTGVSGVPAGAVDVGGPCVPSASRPRWGSPPCTSGPLSQHCSTGSHSQTSESHSRPIRGDCLSHSVWDGEGSFGDFTSCGRCKEQRPGAACACMDVGGHNAVRPPEAPRPSLVSPTSSWGHVPSSPRHQSQRPAGLPWPHPPCSPVPSLPTRPLHHHPASGAPLRRL